MPRHASAPSTVSSTSALVARVAPTITDSTNGSPSRRLRGTSIRAIQTSATTLGEAVAGALHANAQLLDQSQQLQSDVQALAQ